MPNKSVRPHSEDLARRVLEELMVAINEVGSLEVIKTLQQLAKKDKEGHE